MATKEKAKKTTVDIDGQNLNAYHYAGLKEEEAVERMIKDQEVFFKETGKSEEEAREWCEKALAECVRLVEANKE